ncbi:MAG TPA: type II toxin-antitoxin system death-on-curing family toxin [Micromonospora sp.]|nr:type II toxin-antitoxin system death-on-curing family toxin [Micromonospora sp.]
MTYYLTSGDVVAIAEEIGAGGALRDFGLLDAAIGRPQASMFGADAYPDVGTKAAALMHSIIANPPFVDGNKRTGLTAGLAFLELNRVGAVEIDQDAAYELTINVASHKISDVEEIAAALRLIVGG